jgi:hypothetical protein
VEPDPRWGPGPERTFSVQLDTSTGGANKFNNHLFLEIKVGDAPALTPRQPLVSVAYAMKADSVKDGSVTAASLANASITADKFAANLFNPLAWLLGGNSGAVGKFLGTTDTQPLELRVNNRRAMRYTYAENTTHQYRSSNVLGGSEVNQISVGVVGATIAGGGQDVFTGLDGPNRVTADFGTVGGGYVNTAGHLSTIGGGVANTASLFSVVGGGIVNTASGPSSTIGGGVGNTAGSDYATVAGGNANIASGFASTIAGGVDNIASGLFSFAAGRRARARHNGSFVWANSTFAEIASTANDQFVLRATGGVKLSPETTLELGFGVAGKNANAGQIGYAAFTPDTLDIVGAGTSATNRKVKIWAEGGTTFTGNLNVNGTNFTSDARYKQNIAPFDNALDTILHLRGVRFEWDRERWKERGFVEGRQIGFLAQEVEKVLPELVCTDEQGYKSVAYLNIVPVLVEAVKTQQKQQANGLAEIKALQTEIAELKALVQRLAELQKAGQK